MIRIRFHGRGGQGMKTASRVVGTAAVLDGLVAQDSPVYGAERRGAPMAAFVRIARGPILERGVIAAPDLVVVADDTLLDDPAVRPLAGLPPDGGLVLASASVDAVRARAGHAGPAVVRDFRALALEHGGSAAALSGALAAATCALVGLSEAAADAALEAELRAIGLPGPVVDANRRLAARARAGLGPLAPPTAPLRGGPPGAVVDVAYLPPELGTARVAVPPNTPRRQTGSWRVFRPMIDLARCTRCWICFVRCPDGAIDLDPDDTPRIDYATCKGCLICVEECPTHAITAVREERARAPAEAAR